MEGYATYYGGYQQHGDVAAFDLLKSRAVLKTELACYSSATASCSTASNPTYDSQSKQRKSNEQLGSIPHILSLATSANDIHGKALNAIERLALISSIAERKERGDHKMDDSSERSRIYPSNLIRRISSTRDDDASSNPPSEFVSLCNTSGDEQAIDDVAAVDEADLPADSEVSRCSSTTRYDQVETDKLQGRPLVHHEQQYMIAASNGCVFFKDITDGGGGSRTTIREGRYSSDIDQVDAVQKASDDNDIEELIVAYNRKGGEHTEPHAHIFTERERRKKMRCLYDNLQNLLGLPVKANKATILDKTISKIQVLEKTKKFLLDQKALRCEKVQADATTAPDKIKLRQQTMAQC